MEPERLAPSVTGPPDLDFTLPAWQSEAACLNADPDMFWPEKGGDTRPAKALCQRCPVAEECLAFALKQEASDPSAAHGVWGGLSPHERKRIHQARRRTAA